LTLTADRTAFWAHSEFGNALEVPGPALEPAFLQVTRPQSRCRHCAFCDRDIINLSD